MRKALLFCQANFFSNLIGEHTFGELVDHLKSYRICLLEVAWFIKDINLICEIFYCIPFDSVPLTLRCV